MAEILKKSDFYFDLPKELIAQTPADKRDHSRLLCLDRVSGEIEHKHFYQLADMLQKGDCLVLNDTRVIPARLIGNKANTGARVELLLLNDRGNNVWQVMVKPGKKALPGVVISFGDGILKATVLSEFDGGTRLVKMEYDGIFNEILDKLGTMPLPPYITKKLDDGERYQTVYSKVRGSAAAPTAGLHFTKDLLEQIRLKGVDIAYLTLHVGIGTFRPVKEENVLNHKMHSEWYSVSGQAAETINNTRKRDGRIIAVGTTACRTLETVADDDGFVREQSGNTDIFIYPGYRFKAIDGLVTNFHLPESTLIMLVSAFAGRENVLNAYKCAINENYRFFSFGDAMFIA